MNTQKNTIYPISSRTGEPRVPFPIWLAILSNLTGAVCITISTVYSLIMAIYDYGNAAKLTKFSLSHKPEWVQNLDQSYPPEWAGWKFIFVILIAVLAVFLISLLLLSVYYTRWGQRWARRLTWVSGVCSGLVLLLTKIALPAIPLALLAAVFISFPVVGRFITAWEERREPKITQTSSSKKIIYGDFPRYLT